MDPPLLSSCSVGSTYTLWCVIHAHVHVGTNPCASIKRPSTLFLKDLFIHFLDVLWVFSCVPHTCILPIEAERHQMPWN